MASLIATRRLRAMREITPGPKGLIEELRGVMDFLLGKTSDTPYE